MIILSAKADLGVVLEGFTTMGGEHSMVRKIVDGEKVSGVLGGRGGAGEC